VVSCLGLDVPNAASRTVNPRERPQVLVQLEVNSGNFPRHAGTQQVDANCVPNKPQPWENKVAAPQMAYLRPWEHAQVWTNSRPRSWRSAEPATLHGSLGSQPVRPRTASEPTPSTEFVEKRAIRDAQEVSQAAYKDGTLCFLIALRLGSTGFLRSRNSSITTGNTALVASSASRWGAGVVFAPMACEVPAPAATPSREHWRYESAALRDRSTLGALAISAIGARFREKRLSLRVNGWG
jgi:hypothetical protein